MLKVAVLRFPGINCEDETVRAAEQAGARAELVWHRATSLDGADIVIIPGGFSYGDYLRAGAIARFSPVMAAVRAHAEAGRPVLGICNGFQILCESHLLPGALMRNAGLTFVSRPVACLVEQSRTPFTGQFTPGQRLMLPVAHGDGRFVADTDTLRMLEAEGRVVLRYASDADNPNGAVDNIAGIMNAAGNVVGIMPHPERAMGELLGNGDGAGFFTSMAGWHALRAAPARVRP
ncbi:MAG TPA: phosphoribosylformylglycinamidine synthase subunit PurQ [Gemmatimonadales bacterium]|jgi:phosphoribosylformylglycinamidine synthase|nr:phosphoribosylformylglycinamidine synthase subunit PurQ [Gemmatimonadales bacterium]